VTTYTYGQLETLWEQAGGSASLAPTMAAIALAESGGNSAAYNPSGASGPWQVEIPANSQYVPGGASNVFNGPDNAAAAVAIEKAQGLSAWTTYTSGAYKQFLSGAAPATTSTTASAATSSSGGSLWPSGVTGFFTDLDKALGGVWGALAGFLSPGPWIRAGAGLAGVLLLALGLFALAKAAM
jgi:hypothetical protein